MNDNAVKSKNFRLSNNDNNAKAYGGSFINSCHGYQNVISLILRLLDLNIKMQCFFISHISQLSTILLKKTMQVQSANVMYARKLCHKKI